MTVQSSVSRISYAGDGATTAFSVNFYFLVNGDLRVIVRAVDGTETVQTLGTHYSVSGAGNPNGGTVTFVTAPANGTTVVIVRDPPTTQLTAYNNQDPFPASSHERALDKLTMLIQRREEKLNRAILLKESSALSSLTYPDPEAGKLLRWNAAANGIENAVVTDGTETLPTAANRFLHRNAAGNAFEGLTYSETQAKIAFANSFAKTLAADGVADDVAALVALEGSAEEVIRLKNATYYIGTNYTPTKTLRFSSGTRFLITQGVTVDFSIAEPEIHAPKKQRFVFGGTGSGAVVGLDEAHAGWFAGDKLGTTTNALTELQKWAASVRQGGVLHWPRGVLTSDGSAFIKVPNNATIRGKNREQSVLRFSGAQTRGFEYANTNGVGGHIEHFGFDRANNLIAPTAGYTVQFLARRWTAQFVKTDGCYGGFDVDAPDGKFFGCDFFDTRKSCVRVEGVNETQGSTGIFAANSSWVTLSGITGAFQSGESFTFAGGAGNAIFTDGTDYKIITTTTAAPVGTVITGSVSGATATIATLINGHEDGAIRLQQRCHASKFSFIEASGGDYPLLVVGTAANDAGRSLSTKFTACHFDSAKAASAALFYAVGTQFLGCWFSSFDGVNQDVYLEETDATDLVACQWTFSNRSALSATGGSRRTTIQGGVIADTNASNTAGIPAIKFDAGATGVVENVDLGVNYGYGPNNPKIGIQIGLGCDVVVDNVDVSAFATPIQDDSDGTAKIRNTQGYKTRASGAATMPTGGSVVVTHGLGKTPVAVFITPLGDPQVRYFVPSGNLTATTFTAACNATPAAAWDFVWEAYTYHE